jgi:hypothetical protein
MFDQVFALCVNFLVWLAGLLGITYKEVNVWLFVIIWPLFTLALITVVVIQRGTIKKLRSRNSSD